jgi:hypothetical protein
MRNENSLGGDDAELEMRLRPLGAVQVDDVLARSAADLALRMEDEPVRAAALKESRSARRRSRAGFAAMGVLAAVLTTAVAVPVTAVGEWLSARTGEYGDPERGTEEDATEWLNLSGEDLPAIVAEAYPDGLQLPASDGRREAIQKVDALMAGLGSEPNSLAQEGLITTTFEFWAICAWYDEWLIADDADDAPRRDAASQWLGDPGHYPSIVANDGGGVVDRLLEVAGGAVAGDRDLVEDGYREGACDGMLERDE